MPYALLIGAQPGDIKNQCRELIKICGEGSGFILAGGGMGVGKANPDNLRAMMEALKVYST